MSTETTNNKPAIPPLSSIGLLARIADLEAECTHILEVLDFRGQHVAASGMYDAVCGLRKTQGVWNQAIQWP